MADYKFRPHERAAVFSAHGERCYMCGKSLDLLTMEVDHVIPESLLKTPQKLAEVLHLLGRPAGFEINSFENWLPACGPCNSAKQNIVYEPAPIALIWLQRAAAKADEARAKANAAVTSREIGKALSILARAQADGQLDEKTLKTIARYVEANRDPSDLIQLVQPIRITPLYEVLVEEHGLRIVRGPYGIGARPAGTPDASFNCPNCGSIAAWNGARCVICGMQDDD